ncbi:MAG: DUF488 domain-containing protein [Rhodoferax sp.]|nr:DUF488 domain-containing protein [Rhodoferax sp.]
MDLETTVYTVGHSTHSIENFLNLLQGAGITAIADVRSQPFSRFTPQFNRAALADALRERNIAYVFVGKELGARSDDLTCYERGQVRYERLARTAGFKVGLDRVMAGTRKFKVALMCAEKEPLECHRTLLVGRALHDQGVNVAHIHANGSIESYDDAMSRLFDMTGVPREDLFLSAEELQKEALERQEQRVAYIDEKLAMDSFESIASITPA